MIGIFISITPAVLLDLFGLDKLPNTLGSNFLVIGIGYLLGGPVMRKFIDFISVHVIGHLTCPLAQTNRQSFKIPQSGYPQYQWLWEAGWTQNCWPAKRFSPGWCFLFVIYENI